MKFSVKSVFNDSQFIVHINNFLCHIHKQNFAGLEVTTGQLEERTGLCSGSDELVLCCEATQK